MQDGTQQVSETQLCRQAAHFLTELADSTKRLACWPSHRSPTAARQQHITATCLCSESSQQGAETLTKPSFASDPSAFVTLLLPADPVLALPLAAFWHQPRLPGDPIHPQRHRSVHNAAVMFCTCNVLCKCLSLTLNVPEHV